MAQAKWRAVSTSLRKSDKWRNVSDQARVLWLGILLTSDAYGRMEGDTLTLQALAVGKHKGWTKTKTKKALDELIEASLVYSYKTDDDEYIELANFDDHQHGEFLRHRGVPTTPLPPWADDDGVTTEPPTNEANIASNATGGPAGVNNKQIQKQIQIQTQIMSVFEHWVKTDVETGGGRAAGRILNAKRKKLIKDRLKEGYTVEQMQQAITAFCNDPWHKGDNPRQTRYTGVATLLKSGDKIESGLQKYDQQNRQAKTNNEYVRPVANVE